MKLEQREDRKQEKEENLVVPSKRGGGCEVEVNGGGRSCLTPLVIRKKSVSQLFEIKMVEK